MKTLKTNKLTICCGDLSKFPVKRFDFYQDYEIISMVTETANRLEVEFDEQGWQKEKVVAYFHIPEDFRTPQEMRLFARRIGELINSGYKILITTHNDYLIKELNILILFYHRTEEAIKTDQLALEDKPSPIRDLIQKYNYKIQQFLNPENVIAYDFDKRIKQCKIDYQGIEVESIDKIINEMNLITDKLLFELEQ